MSNEVAASRQYRDELGAFAKAIATIESQGRYDAVGPKTKSGHRARGKYQIMEQYWDAWAKEAGIPGADWTDHNAQERVAAYKFSQYYRKFQRWDAVAVAWFAGPGRAAQYLASNTSVGGMKDITGTSVAGYVERTMKIMGSAGYPEVATPYNYRSLLALNTGAPNDVRTVPDVVQEQPTTLRDMSHSVMSGFQRLFEGSGELFEGAEDAG